MRTEGKERCRSQAISRFLYDTDSLWRPLLTSRQSFLPLLNTVLPNPYPAGYASTVSSRLIPTSYFNSAERSATVAKAAHDAMRKNLQVGTSAEFQIFANSPTTKHARSKTSVTPVSYDSLWHVYLGQRWDESSGVGGKAVTRNVIDSIQVLRDAVPDGAVYQNEVSNLSRVKVVQADVY